MEIIEPNKNYLLYYTKYNPYNEKYITNNYDFDSIEINEENENNKNILTGRWSQREHFLFIKGCLIYGNFWKNVKKYIKTRSCSQIRSHAQKYLYKLNKKYFGSETQKKINMIFQNKLTEEEKHKLANKNKFNEKDLEEAELYILSLFKGNKDKYRIKNFIGEKNVENDFRKIINKKTVIPKEKIFSIKKKMKNEKEGMKMRKGKHKYETVDYISITNEKENTHKYMNNKIENELKDNGNDKKILKEEIMTNKDDIDLSKKEKFINKCLDSKDPKDLIKLLTYFGNDVNFEVNDLNIIKKYQYYLGLNLQNEEKTNIDYNLKNKMEENKDITNIINCGYPYLITHSDPGIQLNPLYKQKIILNPQIITQS